MNKNISTKECDMLIRYLTRYSKNISKIIMIEESWEWEPEVVVVPKYASLRSAAKKEAENFFADFDVLVTVMD